MAEQVWGQAQDQDFMQQDEEARKVAGQYPFPPPPAMEQGQHPDSPQAMAGISPGGSGLPTSFDGRMPATYGYGYTPDQAFVHATSPSSPSLDDGAMQFSFPPGAAGNPYGTVQVSGKSRKEIKRRTKTGCLTCRKRRIKCDEAQPSCNNCRKSRRACAGYDPTFRNHPVAADPSIQSSPTSTASKGVSKQPSAHSTPSQTASYPAPPAGYTAASNTGYDNYSTTPQQAGAVPYDFSAAIDPALQNMQASQPTPGAAMYSQPSDFHVDGEPALFSSLLAETQQNLPTMGRRGPGRNTDPVQLIDVPPSLFKPVIPRPEGMPFGLDILSPVKSHPDDALCDCPNLPPGSDEILHCMRHGVHAPEESPVDPSYTFTEFCITNLGLTSRDKQDRPCWLPTVALFEEETQQLWEMYCEASLCMFRITFFHGFYAPNDPRKAIFKASTFAVDGRVYVHHDRLDDQIALTLRPVRPVPAEELLQVSSLEYPSERPQMPPTEDTLQQILELFKYYSTGLAKFLESQWLPVHGFKHLIKDPALIERYALLLSRMEFTADRNPTENLVNLTVESYIIWDSLALVKAASDDIRQTEAQDLTLTQSDQETGDLSFAAAASANGNGPSVNVSESSATKSDEEKKSAQINPPPLPSNADSVVYIDVHETALRFEVLKALITNTVLDPSVVDAISAFDNAVPPHFGMLQKQFLTRERAFWRNTAKFLTLDTITTDPLAMADATAVDEALASMRGLLESKENRDIMYSVAVMRVWPRRLIEREAALKEAGNESPQLDKEDLQKVDIAKNFLVQQAAGRGTSVASQRICGMILKAWSGPGMG